MTDKLALLEQLAPQAQTALATRRLGQSLAGAEHAARDALTDRDRLLALLDIIEASNGAANGTIRSMLAEAFDAFEDVGGALATATDAVQLRGIEGDYRRLKGALARLIPAVRDHWAQIVAKEFHPLHTIGDVLIKVAKTKKLGERMQAVAETAADAGRQSTLEAFGNEVKSAMQARAAVNAERKDLFGDPEVDAFLESAAAGTASLEDVTPGVLLKLKELNALAAFKVSG